MDHSPPKPYQWDFDRALPNGDVDFLTFSVGVFQWLPKASGRGLKKSTSIRVKGYAADYKSVHDKAQELCKRLNRDQVRSDDPPAWVQKQYSVRPAVPQRVPECHPKIAGCLGDLDSFDLLAELVGDGTVNRET